MKTIWNRTSKPLRITLHGGHILHLGPNKTGQLTDEDAERPSLRRLIERREVVVVEDASAEEIRSLPHVERELRPDHSHRKVVIPTGGRTAGGRRQK
jgi:hypothetical protein